ncbi:peptidase U35 [Rhodobacter sp. TJ_12]|uniref:HK97 family phage prohead protease n=1 Tax=Rhodobacter sp. TJ_12 TaxID=2029399 RepID=UPI001CBD749D|nr:HK97 family phage prohead protease [Rhodobacter sp. TJ_12]MBZ4024033.1 peptidase U35 [Rhodobacter sp. TJ_12]
METDDYGLERKFCRGVKPVQLAEGLRIEGYASLFGEPDRGGDVVQPGAYADSLARIAARGGSVKMLWQHDPSQPIGVWDEIAEDARGLRVKGRLLPRVARAREAAALVSAGAIDGLSIGYRTIRADRNAQGQRLLAELDLWEVSLVTFPMLGTARVAAKATAPWHDLAAALRAATAELAAR